MAINLQKDVGGHLVKEPGGHLGSGDCPPSTSCIGCVANCGADPQLTITVAAGITCNPAAPWNCNAGGPTGVHVCAPLPLLGPCAWGTTAPVILAGVRCIANFWDMQVDAHAAPWPWCQSVSAPALKCLGGQLTGTGVLAGAVNCVGNANFTISTPPDANMVETIHCTSRFHCASCRNDPKFHSELDL